MSSEARDHISGSTGFVPDPVDRLLHKKRTLGGGTGGWKGGELARIRGEKEESAAA